MCVGVTVWFGISQQMFEIMLKRMVVILVVLVMVMSLHRRYKKYSKNQFPFKPPTLSCEAHDDYSVNNR